MKTSDDHVTPRDIFLGSLNRCAVDDTFISTFYERFLNSSDEVSHKFRFTEFDKQQEMLLKSLRISAAASSGEPAALREVAERSRTHDRNHLDIRPVLYDLWLDALINTAREFDRHWDETTEDAWRTVLGFVVKHMTSRY